MLSTAHKKTFLISGVIALIFVFAGCRNRVINLKALEVDSMRTVAISLLDSVGSHNIRELHEVWQSLNDDLSLVYDSMYEEIVNSNITTRYVSLFTDVHSCVLACNSYHEEIFFLESDLQELHEQIGTSGITEDSINRKIAYESELLKDLLIRIDTNLDKITGYIESFYELKPQMDSLFILSGVEIHAP